MVPLQYICVAVIFGLLVIYVLPDMSSDFSGLPDLPGLGSDDFYAGFRASSYGYMYEAEPAYWVYVAKEMAKKFPGSKPSAIWIVSIDYGDGTSGLSFPGPGGNYNNIAFDNVDMNERYLDAFDAAGMKVWLQVEPADASVDQLIDLVLSRYKHHPSVIGFGVDVEWLNSNGNPGGRPVTNAEAQRWIQKVRSYNSNYKLFLKHWDASYMPAQHYNGIVYISDSLDVASVSDLIDSFQYEWSDKVPGRDVAYQIGYNLDYQNNGGNDRDWWGLMQDPAKTIGSGVVQRIPDTMGIYWVDFSVRDVFPGP